MIAATDAWQKDELRAPAVTFDTPLRVRRARLPIFPHCMVSLSPRIALGAVALLMACGTHDSRRTIARLPPAEFLVATQDSTFWISSGPAGIRVRGAPLTLANFDNRYYEIFLADDDRSFEDALLVGLRVYRRDLIAGDSAVVFEDTIVPRMARDYARTHPAARPLAPDEDGAEEPPIQALADLEVVGVQGPYLSYEYHVDVTNRGGDPWHATRRGVIDLRSGRSLRVGDLLSAPTASVLVDSGKRELAALVDSVRAASQSTHEDAATRRAARALSMFRFDERSFVLTVPDSQPAIEFDVPQRGIEVPDDVLTLDPLRVAQAPWWPPIARNYPVTGDNVDRWDRMSSSGYSLLARYDSSAGSARLSLADRSHEWPIGIVAAPILHVLWLDKPAIDSAQRRALSRAFNEASLYDETTRTVRDTRRFTLRGLLAAWHVVVSRDRVRRHT